MYKITNSAGVLRNDGAFIPADPANTDYAAYQQWLTEGNTPEPADQPTQVQIIESIKVATQSHLDVTAQSLGYDDIKTAVTYANEPSVPKFQAEGQALRAWRSLVWEKCYEMLEEVKSGNREVVDVAGVIAELPTLTFPN